MPLGSQGIKNKKRVCIQYGYVLRDQNKIEYKEEKEFSLCGKKLVIKQKEDLILLPCQRKFSC
jgi:hypothetical protein